MSKKSLFALVGLVLLTACSSPTGPSTTLGDGSQRRGPNRETCPDPVDRSPSNPGPNQLAAQEKQCVPME